jgi:PAS domain S-box-containing protein
VAVERIPDEVNITLAAKAFQTAPTGLEILNAVSTSIAGSASLRKRLSAAAHQILSLIGYDGYAIYLAQPNKRMLRLILCEGVGAKVVSEYGSVRYGTGIAGRVAQFGQPVFAANFEDLESWTVSPQLHRLGVETFAAVPLRVRNSVVGVLNLSSCSARDISLQERQVLQAAGNILGVAIENAKLLERTRTSERAYQSLYEDAPDIYITTDELGRILRCNRTGQELLQVRRSKLVGKQWTSLCTPESRPLVEHRLHQLSDQRLKGFTANAMLTKPDGDAIAVSIHATSVFRKGKLEGTRIALRDVTSSQRLEKQLQAAQKLESLGTLAGGIAHDFNNLLVGILGASSALTTKLVNDPPLHFYAATVEQSAQRASHLVSQLLAFARGNPLRMGLVDLNHIVRESLPLIERSIPSEVALEVEVGAGVLPIYADSSQIQQVVVNLCLNARDAIERDGAIRLSTCMDPEAKTVSLCIADTGSGMDEATQEHIFEPFFSTKEVGKGTGLGLFIAYGIMERHNGDIRVESAPGKGTRMLLSFPACEPQGSSAGGGESRN